LFYFLPDRRVAMARAGCPAIRRRAMLKATVL